MSDSSGFPPYEPGPDLPAARPPRLPTPGHRLGRAEGVVVRIENQGADWPSETVLAFRLVDGESGGRSEVELRGRSIQGTVRDGDWVEVADTPGRSGRLEPRRVVNLTTGSEVGTVGDRRSPAMRVLAVLLILVFLAVVAFIGYTAFTMFTEPGF